MISAENTLFGSQELEIGSVYAFQNRFSLKSRNTVKIILLSITGVAVLYGD